MTSLQFIEKQFYATHGLEKHHNSLYRDSKGNIYSYGYHYPLMFTADDSSRLVFINTTGYSNTTSKHIGHAWNACDYKAIGIKLNGRRLSPEFKLRDALELLTRERAEIIRTMNSKKRKDTYVYRALVSELAKNQGYIDQVKGAMSWG